MPNGKVSIYEERCKGCGLCIAACPQNVLAFSGKINKSGYNYVHMEHPEKCVGCAFCATARRSRRKGDRWVRGN